MIKLIRKIFCRNWKNIERLEKAAFNRGINKGKIALDRACKVAYTKGYNAGVKWATKNHE